MQNVVKHLVEPEDEDERNKKKDGMKKGSKKDPKHVDDDGSEYEEEPSIFDKL
jgi:hypothetical protein